MGRLEQSKQTKIAEAIEQHQGNTCEPDDKVGEACERSQCNGGNIGCRQLFFTEVGTGTANEECGTETDKERSQCARAGWLCVVVAAFTAVIAVHWIYGDCFAGIGIVCQGDGGECEHCYECEQKDVGCAFMVQSSSVFKVVRQV